MTLTLTLIVRVEEQADGMEVYPLGSIIQYPGDPPQGWIVYPHGEPIPERYKAALQAIGYGDLFPDFRGRVIRVGADV